VLRSEPSVGRSQEDRRFDLLLPACITQYSPGIGAGGHQLSCGVFMMRRVSVGGSECYYGGKWVLV